MGLLDVIGTLAGSIFSGGLTGILGVAVQRWADYKNKQLDLQAQRERQAHAVAMKQADAAIMAQEWAARTQVAKIETEGARDVADAGAFAASFAAEPKRYAEGPAPKGWLGRLGWFLLSLVDVARGLVRPGLTVYLCVLTTLIYRQARGLLENMAARGDQLTVTEAMELNRLIIGTVLYLTTTCVLWWFGTRNKGKQPGAPA